MIPFFVLAVTTAGGRVGSFLRGHNHCSLRTRGMITSRSVYIYVYMVRHPLGSYIVNKPIAVSASGHTRMSINQLTRSSIPGRQENPPQKAVLSRMQLTLHATRPAPHSASRLVQAISAWPVKTRRTPSRHCGDARVYGLTTIAMHDSEYTPPPPPHPQLFYEGLR